MSSINNKNDNSSRNNDDDSNNDNNNMNDNNGLMNADDENNVHENNNENENQHRHISSCSSTPSHSTMISKRMVIDGSNHDLLHAISLLEMMANDDCYTRFAIVRWNFNNDNNNSLDPAQQRFHDALERLCEMDRIWQSIEIENVQGPYLHILLQLLLQVTTKRFYFAYTMSPLPTTASATLQSSLSLSSSSSSSSSSPSPSNSSNNLQYLFLSLNWTPLSSRALMQALPTMTQLHELNLSYSIFQNHQAIEPFFSNNTTGHDNDDNDDNNSMSLLPTLPSLHTLRLNRCRLTDCQLQSLLVNFIAPLSNLQQLYLGGNTIGPLSLLAIADIVPKVKWTHLGMSSSSIISDNATQPINNNNSNTTVTQTNITVPVHQDNDNSTNVWQSIFTALAQSKTLQILHLGSNQFTDSSIQPLLQALHQYDSPLVLLDLRNNFLTVDHCYFNILPPRLQKLWLLGNAQINTTGAQTLLSVVKSHYHLQDIRIPTYGRQPTNDNNNNTTPRLRHSPEMRFWQQQLQYYGRLNLGGRRLLLQPIPLALWPFVLERVNKFKTVGRGYALDRGKSEIIYYLLRHGPALLER